MKATDTPENGALLRFIRNDDDQWREGEFDLKNQLFIEIYSAELTTHNKNDIKEWVYLSE